MQYRLYGLLVYSTLPMKSLTPLAIEAEVDLDQIDVMILPSELSELKEEVGKFIKANGERNDQEEPLWLIERLSREECHIVLIDTGFFRITSGTRIEYCKTENASDLDIEQSILIFCMAVLLIQRERVVLHGSGLLYQDQLIVISGESGSGKSSLSHELLNEGCRFMADDAVALELEGNEVYGFGSFPLRRLCPDVFDPKTTPAERIIYMPDGGRDKYGIDMRESYYDCKTRLGAIYIIQPLDIEEVRIRKVEGMEQIKCIHDNLYKKSSYQRIGFSPKMMSQCVGIVKNTPIYVIERPKTGMTVKEQVKLVQENMWELL